MYSSMAKGTSQAEQQKNQARSLAIVELHESEGIRQSASQLFS